MIVVMMMKSMMMMRKMWSLDVSFISIDRSSHLSFVKFWPGLVGIILVETCFVFFFFLKI